MGLTTKITSLESLCSWFAAIWAMVLFHPRSYFESYPVFFSGVKYFVSETELALIFAAYFILTTILFETRYFYITSLLHFIFYGILSALFFYGDSYTQIVYAYGLISIFNLLRWFTYITNDKQNI